MPHLYNKNNVNIISFSTHDSWIFLRNTNTKKQPNRIAFFYVFLQNRTHKSFIILKLCFTSRSFTCLLSELPSRISPRPISDIQLSTLLYLHPCPIYLVVFKGSLVFLPGYLILRGASRLDAFSVYPCRTWLLCHGIGLQQIHQRSVHPGPLVLRTAPLRYPAPTPDRDRTVSRRSEPSSRTALMGEQPNPWNRLQLQDAMSRHRGAKPPRRCGLLGEISLLSPG